MASAWLPHPARGCAAAAAAVNAVRLRPVRLFPPLPSEAGGAAARQTMRSLTIGSIRRGREGKSAEGRGGCGAPNVGGEPCGAGGAARRNATAPKLSRERIAGCPLLGSFRQHLNPFTAASRIKRISIGSNDKVVPQKHGW